MTFDLSYQRIHTTIAGHDRLFLGVFYENLKLDRLCCTKVSFFKIWNSWHDYYSRFSVQFAILGLKIGDLELSQCHKSCKYIYVFQ